MVISRKNERYTVPYGCFVLENHLNFVKEKYFISKYSGASVFAIKANVL